MLIRAIKITQSGCSSPPAPLVVGGGGWIGVCLWLFWEGPSKVWSFCRLPDYPAHLEFPVFPFFTLFNKVEKVHRYNTGKGGDELPIHHGVSVQGHEENLAAASWSDGGKEHLRQKKVHMEEWTLLYHLLHHLLCLGCLLSISYFQVFYFRLLPRQFLIFSLTWCTITKKHIYYRFKTTNKNYKTQQIKFKLISNRNKINTNLHYW